MKDQRLTVYAGSFDPITNGHLDLLERALKMFDHIIIAVAENPAKEPLFTLEERLELIRASLAYHAEPHRIKVDSFKGLLVDYVEECGAMAILRGLRAVSDFEYEFQMALTNRKLAPSLHTVFLVPDERYTYLNSTIVREVARLGGDVSEFVPPLVRARLEAKFR